MKTMVLRAVLALAAGILAANRAPSETAGSRAVIMILPGTNAWTHPESTTVGSARAAVRDFVRRRITLPRVPLSLRDELAFRARHAPDLAADAGYRQTLAACDRALSTFRGERGRLIKRLHSGFVAAATATLDAQGIAVLATDPLSGIVFVDGSRHQVAAVRRLFPGHAVELVRHFGPDCVYANAETRAAWLHGLGVTGGPGAGDAPAFDYLNVDSGVDTTCADIVGGHAVHGATDPARFYDPFPTNGYGDHGSMTCGIVTSDHGVARGVAPDLDAIFVASNRAVVGIHWTSIEQQIKGYSWGVAETDSLFGDSPEVAHCSASINVSAYTGFSRYLDSLVDAFDLFLGCSAGNFGWSGRFRVMDAGHAYNALVANALVMQQDSLRANTSVAGPLTQYTVGGWGPAADGRKKPDLSVPVEGMWIQDDTGATFQVVGAATSFSSPQIAGAGLLLMQRGVTSPRSIKALLINTAFRPDSMSAEPWQAGYGWGMLDLRHAVAHADQGDWFEQTAAADGRGGDKRYYLGTFMPFAAEDNAYDRATLVWERHLGWSYADTSVAAGPLTDLDLYLYDAADARLLMASTSQVDNVEQVWWHSATDTLRLGVLVVDCESALPPGWDWEPFTLATEEGFAAVGAPKGLVGLQVANRPFPAPQVRQEYTIQYLVRLDGMAACDTIRPSLSGLDAGTAIVSGPSPPHLVLAQGDSAVVSYVLLSATRGERSPTFTASATCYRTTWSDGVRTAYTVLPDLAAEEAGDESSFRLLAIESGGEQTVVRFAGAGAAAVRLGVYDVRGRKLFEGRATGAAGVLHWPHADRRGGRIASGVYFLRLQVAGRTVTRKVSVVR